MSLTGSVPLLRTKLQLETQLAGLQGIRGIRDGIRVTGPAVSDTTLRAELERNVRNAKVTYTVHNGEVVLASRPLDPASAGATPSAVAATPGVLAIANKMNVILWGPEPGQSTYSLSKVP